MKIFFLFFYFLGLLVLKHFYPKPLNSKEEVGQMEQQNNLKIPQQYSIEDSWASLLCHLLPQWHPHVGLQGL